MMELWPFTNFHDLNLDWIIRKIKNVETSEANAKASEEAAADSASDAAGRAGLALVYQNKAKDYRDEAQGFANNAQNSANSIAGIADQVAVNTGRIDGLIAHAGDGTTPSELIDVRVQADGFVNTTAGDAVRAQADFNLQAIMAFTAQAERLPEPTWNSGYIGANGSVTPATANNEEYTSDFYTFDRFNFYAVYYEVPYGQQAWAAAGRYDNDTGTWIDRWDLQGDSMVLDKIEINDNGRLIRFLILKPNLFNQNAKINFMARKYTTSAFRIYKIPADFYARTHSKIALLLPSGQGYTMNIDSTTKVVSFPADNLLIAYGAELRRNVFDGQYMFKSIPAGTVDCSSLGTSAVNIWYDLENETYTATAYSTYYAYKNDKLYWIASIRFGAKPVVTTMGPYRIDGVPLGISAVEAYRLTPAVKAINHRGYNTLAPENTLPAFKLSKKNGFDYIECDVQLTSDNVPVVIHDATINRTATNLDGTPIASPVYVYNTTLQDLIDNYDFGRWFDAAYAGTKIPTWWELCALARRLGLHVYCEIKAESPWNQAKINDLLAIAKTCGVYDNITYTSFDTTLLGYVKTADPDVRIGYLSNTLANADIDTAKALDAFIDCSHTAVTDAAAAYAAGNDVELEVWTVDSDATMNALSQYVTGVTSNYMNAAKVLYDSNI